jgi:hypothetical protein
MGKLGTSADEATLLKAYKISSLAPTTWEEVDHELEQSVAGALTGPTPTTEADADPLGLGSSINLGNLDMESSEFHLPNVYYSHSLRPSCLRGFCYHHFQVFRTDGLPLCRSPERHLPGPRVRYQSSSQGPRFSLRGYPGVGGGEL